MVTLCKGEVLTAADPCWVEALARVRHDIYHTSAYHQLGGLGREGEAFAFLYREGDRAFVWPYLLKATEGEPGAYDVSSVYGYAGPVSAADPAFVGRAWQQLQEAWRGQGVVSAFTRFNPLLGNQDLLRGVRDERGRAVDEGVRFHGPTVSIDLRPSLDEQFCRYHKNLRNEIRRGRAAGFVTLDDERWENLDVFVHLYGGAMTRLNSRREYLVDGAWVREFRRTLGEHAHLFVTQWNCKVMAASLAMAYGPFLHCHLIGNSSELLTPSPTKAMLDALRVWGTEHGYESLHLGGGLGGREDSLYQSKRKFSPATRDFYTGSWILNPERYQDLEATHRRRLAEQGIDIGEPSYFPSYRYRPDL